MKIINPISNIEKVLQKKGTNLTPIEFTRPHGYLRCKDENQTIWFIHPEALGVLPYDPRWPLQKGSSIGRYYLRSNAY